MSVETQYTANTGAITISAANANLDGTGTLVKLITAGGKGTLVKTIIIKALVNTTEGMIRLFLRNISDNKYNLLAEIPVTIVTKSSRDVSFQRVIPFNYNMVAGDIIYASTQVAETFNIIAEGLDWDYGVTVREDSTHYTANTNGEVIAIGNSSLTGSTSIPGDIVQIFQAGPPPPSTPGYNGCEISSIIIKAQQSVTPGMVRLFIDDGSHTKYLFSETIIPYANLSANGNVPSFSTQVISNGSFALKANYIIWATTQNTEKFNVVIDGLDWNYP